MLGEYAEDDLASADAYDDRSDVTLCEACRNGDHANCGLQMWCECDCSPDDAMYDDE